MAVSHEALTYYRSITTLQATALASLCVEVQLKLPGMDFPLPLHTLESTPGNWRTVHDKPNTPMWQIGNAIGQYIRPLVDAVIPEETWGPETQHALDALDPGRHERRPESRAPNEIWRLYRQTLSKDQLVGKKYTTGQLLGMTIMAATPPEGYVPAYASEQTTKKGFRFSDPALFFIVNADVKSGRHIGEVLTGIQVTPSIVFNHARLPVRSFRMYTRRLMDSLAPGYAQSVGRAARRESAAMQHPWRGGDCSGDNR